MILVPVGLTEDSTHTIVLKPGETLPSKYNILGVLVFEETGTNSKFRILKGPQDILQIEETK